MKVLHLYITRQILQTLLMTVLVFTGVILLGNSLREILEMLLNRQATAGLVAQALMLLIPFVAAFSLPLGMLTAALLVFGRFSADQELTAARANGVSLVALVTPVLLLSAALCVLSAWINMDIAPRSRAAFKRLTDSVALNNPTALILEDRYVDGFKSSDGESADDQKSYTVYVKKKKGDELFDVLIYQLNTNNVVETRMRAARARVRVDAAQKQLFFELFDGQVLQLAADGQWHPMLFSSWPLPPVSVKSRDKGDQETKISEMSFAQLIVKKRELEQRGIDSTPVKVHLHRQIATSFACIGFALVGIPLGIRAHRRETTFGIAFAIILALVYYSFIFVGQSLETKPQYLPYLLMWAPNFIFQGLGAVLLLRANRGI